MTIEIKNLSEQDIRMWLLNNGFSEEHEINWLFTRSTDFGGKFWIEVFNLEFGIEYHRIVVSKDGSPITDVYDRLHEDCMSIAINPYCHSTNLIFSYYESPEDNVEISVAGLDFEKTWNSFLTRAQKEIYEGDDSNTTLEEED